MKIKARDAAVLWGVVQELEKQTHNVRFSSFIVKTKLALSDIVNGISEAARATDTYLEYDRKRSELASQFADKDANGDPIIRNNNYAVTEKADEFQKAFEELKEQYKEVIMQREEQVKSIDAKLNEDIEVELPTLSIHNFPNISPQMLEPFIKTNMAEE